MPRKINLEHSRPLDVYIWSDKPAIKRTADIIYAKMKRKYQAIKKPNGEIRIPYKNRTLKGIRVLDKLKAILTDLYVAAKQDVKLYLAFSRRASGYKENKRNPQIFLGLKYVMFITDFLNEHNYIELYKGMYCRDNTGFSRLSRMRATRKLRRTFKYHASNSDDTGSFRRRMFPIILRDSQKQDMNIEILTTDVKERLININRINKELRKHAIEIPENVFELDPAGLEDYQAHAIPSNTTYYRVFNNGDINLKQGGRFYGHWSQQIKSKYRQYIRIDGKKTVEADYKCLHISMLYAEATGTIPEGDLYELPGISNEYRPLIKKAVNIFLNAPAELTSMRALALESRAFYNDNPHLQCLKAKTILNAIIEKHMAISKYFNSGYGLVLQNKDSQIAEKIMLHFEEEGIPVLCIHDSFIVDEAYKSELCIVMENVFMEVFNCIPNIKLVEADEDEDMFDYDDNSSSDDLYQLFNSIQDDVNFYQIGDEDDD